MNIRRFTGLLFSFFMGKNLLTEAAINRGVKNSDIIKIPLKPSKEILDFIEYPSRPKGVQTFQPLQIIAVHRQTLQDVQMMLSLHDNSLSLDDYSFTNLVLRPLIEFTRWVHLLPASENHHHSGIGGLLSHSLDTGHKALKNAYGRELPPLGYQDEEKERKRRYLYAAFICGLFHDAGKVFDVDVISVDGGNRRPTWQPLVESLMDWAEKNDIEKYEIIWRKREANAHSVRANIFLERCLNATCLQYLSDVTKERIYDKMLSAVASYAKKDDYLSQAVRSADFYSTGTDLNVTHDPIMGTRTADAVTRAVTILRANLRNININDFSDTKNPMRLIVIGGQIYITESAGIDFIINEFQSQEFNWPSGETGKEALIDSMIQKGIIEPYSEQRTPHFFMPGEYTGTQVNQLFIDGIANKSWYNLLKFKWVGTIFDSYIIPDSISGVFSVHDTHDYLHVDREGIQTLYKRPHPTKQKKIVLGKADTTKANSLIESERIDPVGFGDNDSSPEFDIPAKPIANDSLETKDTAVDQKKKRNRKLSSKPDSKLTKPLTDVVTEEKLNSGISYEDVVLALDTLLKSVDIPSDQIFLVDGVPYVDYQYVVSLTPTISKNHLYLSSSFASTVRVGSLDAEFAVPSRSGRELIQLSVGIAGKQISRMSDFQQDELLDLVSNDIFAHVEFVEVDEQQLQKVVPLDLPKQQVETECSQHQFKQEPDIIKTENISVLSPTNPPSISQNEPIPKSINDQDFSSFTLFKTTSDTGESTDFKEENYIYDDQIPSVEDYANDFNSIFSSKRPEKQTTEKKVTFVSDRPERASRTHSTTPTDELSDVSIGSDDSDLEDFKSVAQFLQKCAQNLSPSETLQLSKYLEINEASLRIKLTALKNFYLFSSFETESNLKNILSRFPVADIKEGRRTTKYYIVSLNKLITAGEQRNIFVEAILGNLVNINKK